MAASGKSSSKPPASRSAPLPAKKSAQSGSLAKTARRIPPKAAADAQPARQRGRPAMPRAQVLSSKLAYKGPVFSVFTDKVTEPNGITSTRDVIHHSGSVVILAVDSSRKPRNPDVILIRQYRHAAGQYLLELPAGRIEPDERPLAAAKREMIEETGFRARKWTPLVRYFASPGFLGEWMQIFLAEDLTAGTAQPEGDEDIELIRLPLSEAMSLANTGKIQDGKTLVGLAMYSAQHKAQT